MRRITQDQSINSPGSERVPPKEIDFEEMFSPIVKTCLIQVVLGLATSLTLEIKQLNINKGFLHGDLEEKIYMD